MVSVDSPATTAAEALKAHQWYFVGNLGVPGMPDSKDYKCSCGWTAGGGIGEGEDPHEHVAAAVIAALGLFEETQYIKPWGYGDEMERRWVGTWQERP